MTALRAATAASKHGIESPVRAVNDAAQELAQRAPIPHRLKSAVSPSVRLDRSKCHL